MFAETAYLFRHALLREAAYQLQPPAERAGLHGLALEIMQAALGDTDEALAPFALELADHARAAAEGASPDRMRILAHREHTLLGLAHHVAARNWRLPEAEQCCRRILESPLADPTQGLRARCNLVATLMQMARVREAAENVEIGLGESASINDAVGRRRLLYNGALLATWRGDLGALKHYAGLLENDTANDPPGLDHARALKLRAEIIERDGNLHGALDCLGRALAELESVGEERECAGVLINIALVLVNLKRYDEAATVRERALQITRKFGEVTRTATLLNNGAFALIEQGRFAEAGALAVEAESLARKARAPALWVRTFDSRQIVLAETGQFAAGEALARRQLAVFLELGFAKGVMGAITHLARCLLEQGRGDQARVVIEESRPLVAAAFDAPTAAQLEQLSELVRQGKVPL